MLHKCATRFQKWSEMFFKFLRYKNGFYRRPSEQISRFLELCLAHSNAKFKCSRNTQKIEKKWINNFIYLFDELNTNKKIYISIK